MGKHFSKSQGEDPAYVSHMSASVDHPYAGLGQHSGNCQTEESVYVTEVAPSTDHCYARLGQSGKIQRDEYVYESQESTSADHQYTSLGISDHIYNTPYPLPEHDPSTLSGHVYTVNVIPTDLSKALKLHSNRKYQLQLKDQSICLSEKHGHEHVWPLNFIRDFKVDSERKFFIFESGRRAASGPGMIECRFHEDFSDLLHDIRKITGTKI